MYRSSFMNRNIIVRVHYTFISGQSVTKFVGGEWKRYSTLPCDWVIHIFGEYISRDEDGKYVASDELIELAYPVGEQVGHTATCRYTKAYAHLRFKFQNMELTKKCQSMDECLQTIVGHDISFNDAFVYSDFAEECGSYWNGVDFESSSKDFNKKKYAVRANNPYSELLLFESDDEGECHGYIKSHDGYYMDTKGYRYSLEVIKRV